MQLTGYYVHGVEVDYATLEMWHTHNAIMAWRRADREQRRLARVQLAERVHMSVCAAQSCRIKAREHFREVNNQFRPSKGRHGIRNPII